MGFASILRQGVAILDQQIADLQDTVQFFAWVGSGTYGEPIYAPAIPLQGIVEEKQFQRKMPDGTEVVQKASITIPRAISPNGAADRREPVDPRDKFVLPTGYTGPILWVNGVMDPSTHAPYSFEIILG